MSSNSSKREVESALALNDRLGLSFSNFSLLTRALTHRSYANEHQDGTEDNERLEFLGDAVLDLIVADWAYRHFPELDEGDLTRIRAHLVANENLAGFARQIDLGGALRLGRGEKSTGGRQRESVLGSTFEALLGAIYLDADFEKAKRFVRPFLDPFQETVMEEISDPKSQLQEKTQAMRLGAPHYRVVDASGPDHDRVYEVEVLIQGEVMGRGKGRSKNAAQREAAKDALKKI